MRLRRVRWRLKKVLHTESISHESNLYPGCFAQLIPLYFVPIVVGRHFHFHPIMSAEPPLAPPAQSPVPSGRDAESAELLAMEARRRAVLQGIAFDDAYYPYRCPPPTPTFTVFGAGGLLRRALLVI